MQFGAKPLFENVSVKFGDGNRYGLIGANGCGKSTLMKILGGDLEPTAGNVSVDPDERVGKLRQDQFAFENHTVLDTVIMGHDELWQVKQERDRIYALPEMSEEDGMKVADLEVQFAELDGYTAEARAGELLLGLDIPLEQHDGPMSAVAPGWKLRVLLAQALFADPDIMLLDEPTNNLDINTIRWLEDVLNARNSTMIIISHDRHFLNSVCTHMADLDYGELRVYPGNYDEYMTAATQARERLYADNAKKKAQIAELQTFVSRFSANASKARQATSRQRQIEKIKLEDIKPSSRVNPFIRFDQDKKLYRLALEVKGLAKGYDGTPLVQRPRPDGRGRRARRHHRPQRHRQDHPAAQPGRRPDAGQRHGQMVREWQARLLRPGPCRRLRRGHHPVRLDGPVETAGRRRAGHPRHPGAAAVLPGRDQEIRQGDLRR